MLLKKRKYNYCSKIISIVILVMGFLFASCQKETNGNNPEIEEIKLQYPELEITNLPTVIINTYGIEIDDRENWIDGNVCIENGKKYNFTSTKMSIKGRGNTTWTQAPKKSYSIKLEKKQSILGLPKHKRWILIANYLDNSFIKNSLAFYLSEYFGLDYTVHGDFVNLVLNDEYLGLYWLGEAIKVDENRVSINKKNDFLLEIDNHYDETWKFRSEIKNLPYNIKNDDYMTEERLLEIQSKINDLEEYLFSGFFPYFDTTCTDIDYSYRERIDIDSFAKYYLVQEIMCNLDYFLDLKNSKYCSVYVVYDNQNGILKAGPVWDFDASFLNYVNKNILNGTKSIYNEALFKIPEFTQKLSELIANSDTLIEDSQNMISELYEKLKVAQQLDSIKWNDESLGLENINFHKDRSGLYIKGYTEFSQYVDFVIEWLKKRIQLVESEYCTDTKNK